MRARSSGTRELIGTHATAAGASFASHAGALDTMREVRSLLRLPLGDRPASEAIPGYRLRRWVGAAPEAILASFARAREAVNDAPLASEHDCAVWDAARVRDLEETIVRRNRETRVTVALDESDEVVAFTELRVSRAVGASAGTEDTAVVREHRRRGLARWVKLESLRHLQHERPDVRLVTTTNAEQNEAMLALNRSLGFSPVAVYTSSVLQV